MESPVFDLHCDAVLKLVHRGARFRNDNPGSHVDIPKMRKGGVDGLILSLWADPAFKGADAVRRTQFMLDRAREELEVCAEEIELCTSSSELERATRGGRISALLGIEGGHSIHSNLDELARFHHQGVRRMTLTHTSSTEWAGSATDDGRTRGLSPFGRDVVRAMNELGMIVDVAHACERTFLDAVAVSSKPVFCTHSLARKVFDSERLASDEMISAIGQSGGIFGIAFFPSFFPNQDPESTRAWMEALIRKLNAGGRGQTLEEKAHDNASTFMDTPPPAIVASLEGVLPHIDHVISLIGEDHIGIGSDFDGIPFCPRGLEDASKLGALRAAMRARGYSTERIAKILGGNVRRVLTEVLPA